MDRLKYAKEVNALYRIMLKERAGLRLQYGLLRAKFNNNPFIAKLNRDIDAALKRGGFKSIDEAVKYRREHKNKKEGSV